MTVQEISCVVSGTVINNDELAALFFAEFEQLWEEERQSLFFVIGRDDNSQVIHGDIEKKVSLLMGALSGIILFDPLPWNMDTYSIKIRLKQHLK